MNAKETFFNDKTDCRIPLTHIEEGIENPHLREIDELYGAADVLSIENAKKHERNLWLLSAFGKGVNPELLDKRPAELSSECAYKNNKKKNKETTALQGLF